MFDKNVLALLLFVADSFYWREAHRLFLFTDFLFSKNNRHIHLSVELIERRTTLLLFSQTQLMIR